MNKIKQLGFSLSELLFTLVILVVGVGGVCGWIANIVKLSHIVSGPVTPMVILRIVGIFAVPLGSILGYIG